MLEVYKMFAEFFLLESEVGLKSGFRCERVRGFVGEIVFGRLLI